MWLGFVSALWGLWGSLRLGGGTFLLCKDDRAGRHCPSEM